MFEQFSTQAEQLKMLKERKISDGMLSFSSECASARKEVECLIKEGRYWRAFADCTLDAIRAADAASRVVFGLQRYINKDESIALLNVLCYSYRLGRAIHGCNEPNVAMYSLLLKHESSKLIFMIKEENV